MREPGNLDLEEIESIEKLSLRALYTAAVDFGFDAWEVFHQSSDDPKDVAEDVTRECLTDWEGMVSLSGFLGTLTIVKRVT